MTNTINLTNQTLLKQIKSAKKIWEQYNHQVKENNVYDYDLLSGIFKSMGYDPYIEPDFKFKLGSNIIFGSNSFINHDTTIIDYDLVTIGNNVNIAPNTAIYTVDFTNQDLIFKTQPVKIEDNVWIGANSIILPGVTIGKNSIVGAGSVVTKNIPENMVVVGNPARILRPINLSDTNSI